MPTGNSKAYLNESDSGPICPAGSFTLPRKWVGRLGNAVSLQDADWLLLCHLSSHWASHSPVPKPWSQQHADLTGRILFKFNWTAILHTMVSGNCILHVPHTGTATPLRQSMEHFLFVRYFIGNLSHGFGNNGPVMTQLWHDARMPE